MDEGASELFYGKLEVGTFHLHLYALFYSQSVPRESNRMSRSRCHASQ